MTGFHDNGVVSWYVPEDLVYASLAALVLCFLLACLRAWLAWLTARLDVREAALVEQVSLNAVEIADQELTACQISERTARIQRETAADNLATARSQERQNEIAERLMEEKAA